MIFKLDNGLLVLKINSVVLVSLTIVRDVNGMLILYCNKCRLNCCTHRFFSFYQSFYLKYLFYRFKGWQIRYSEYWGICKHIIYGVNHFPNNAHTNMWKGSGPFLQILCGNYRSLIGHCFDLIKNMSIVSTIKLVYSFWVTFMIFIMYK